VSTLNQANRQWATRPADERFRTLADLHTNVTNRRRNAQDGNIYLHDVNLAVNGELTMHGKAGGLAGFTHWSAGQLLSKLGVPRDLLAKLSPNVGTSVLNDRLAKALAEGEIDAKQRMLLSVDDDAQRTVRALHGQKYNRLWDCTVTGTLVENLPPGWYNPVAYANGKWGNELEPSGLYAGDRSMFGFFIDGGDWSKKENVGTFDVDGEEFNRGFFVWNSETGSETFGWLTFMFDRICGNHYVWGARNVAEFKARHVGRGASRLLDTFRRYLWNIEHSLDVNGFTKAVRSAKAEIAVPITGSSPAARLETLDLAFNKFKSSFTKSEVTLALDAMLREEKNVTGTRYDWLAGFTAVARELPNADDRSALETKASNLLLAVK
jgi:hypothetical protein